jgi:hypothetical protein
MSTSPPTRKMPLKDRRAAPGAKSTGGSLQHLKSLLGRPLGLQRQGGQVQVVLVERRSPPSADPPTSPPQLCAELRALLLAQEATATQTMRHMVLVHDALESKGWPGVQALSGPVLRRALLQAEMLASVESSSALETIIEQLRLLTDVADQREESELRLQDFKVGDTVEVSESTFAEFETLERSWIGTVPSRLTRLDRDD